MIRLPLCTLIRNLFAAVLVISAAIAAAPGFDIYRLPKGGHRGFGPQAGLVADKAGNLYGTTQFGGTGTCANAETKTVIGCGIVFRLTPPSTAGSLWTQTVLYNFQGGTDSEFPWGGVIFDELGRLYGTTTAGGPQGGGTVFQLTPPQGSGDWTEAILYSFPANFGCCDPTGNLTFDNKGNLFGTTGLLGYLYGDCPDIVPCFGVFELSPASDGSWTGTLLPTTANYYDGLGPTGGLIVDSTGNLYGMAYAGGTSNVGQCFDDGCGTVFELSPPAVAGGKWVANVLHTFVNGTGDGIVPYGSLTADKQGNLYGTTQFGGTGGASGTCQGFGTDFLCGTVFELTPVAGGGWVETILYNFQGGTDGALPSGTLVIDDHGNLYGTTGAGGVGTCLYDLDIGGCGTVFKLAKPNQGGTWSKTTLFEFTQGNGNFPLGQLLFSSGALYGTTLAGGQKCPSQIGRIAPTCGTVFKIIP